MFLGGPCCNCQCFHRLHIKASGFEGGARWTLSNQEEFGQINLFFGSTSYEFSETRPGASSSPVAFDDLELVSDEGFVSLQWTQSAGHVLRLSYNGVNKLLDSDDPVTLSTVEENTLEALPDWMGNDFLTTIGSWELKVLKPDAPCVCNCYCGTDDPASITGAPESYSLEFSEDFYAEEGAFYAPDSPASLFFPSFEETECPIVFDRWAEPFILRRSEGSGPPTYVSEPIAFGRCLTRFYVLTLCDNGTASLVCLSPASPKARAPIAPLPHWKRDEYFDDPTTYTDELFADPIDFGFATVSPSNDPAPAVECVTLPNGDGISAFPGCFAACPPTEITVRIHAAEGDPESTEVFPRAYVDATVLTATTYSLSLVPEESQACLLLYRYETEETATESQSNQTRPLLRIEVTFDGRSSCACGAFAQLSISGITKPMKDWHPDYQNAPPYFYSPDCFQNNNARYAWKMSHWFVVGGVPTVAIGGLTPFGSDNGGNDAACVTPCGESLSLDEPQVAAVFGGVTYQIKKMQPVVGLSPSDAYFFFPPPRCLYNSSGTGFKPNGTGYRPFTGYTIEG